MGWLIVFYDLPTFTKQQRKLNAQFRKALLDDGYHMVQFSVYARPCVTPDRVDTHSKRLTAFLPPAGRIQCLFVTNRQWNHTLRFQGAEAVPPSDDDTLPQQLLLW